MGNRFLSLVSIFCLLPFLGFSQSYKIYPFPNAWYNQVDGLRLGLHVKGQIQGTLDDGPHRLQGGLWMGSKIPTYPVSYYAKFTEPIFSWSSFGSEAAFIWESQFRTGFEAYSIEFSKKKQEGFVANEYKKYSISAHYQRFYTSDYALFTRLISAKPTAYLDLNYKDAHENYLFNADVKLGTSAKAFYQTKFSFQQTYNLTSWLSAVNRNRVVLQSEQTPNHIKAFYSAQSYLEQLENPFFRGKGTIPNSFVTDIPFYDFHEAGIRSELSSELSNLELGVKNYSLVANSSVDLYFDTFISKSFKKIDFIGDMFAFKQYLFADIAYAKRAVDVYAISTSVFAAFSTGFGFSLDLDLPEKDPFMKAFSLKYELPWASFGNKKSPNGVSLQHILSISGTLSF